MPPGCFLSLLLAPRTSLCSGTQCCTVKNGQAQGNKLAYFCDCNIMLHWALRALLRTFDHLKNVFSFALSLFVTMKTTEARHVRRVRLLLDVKIYETALSRHDRSTVKSLLLDFLHSYPHRSIAM